MQSCKGLPSLSSPVKVRNLFLLSFFLSSFLTHYTCAYVYTKGRLETVTYRIKDGNETLYGAYVDEKDDERPLRMYAAAPTPHSHSLLTPAVMIQVHSINCLSSLHTAAGSYKFENLVSDSMFCFIHECC